MTDLFHFKLFLVTEWYTLTQGLEQSFSAHLQSKAAVLCQSTMFPQKYTWKEEYLKANHSQMKETTEHRHAFTQIVKINEMQLSNQ